MAHLRRINVHRNAAGELQWVRRHHAHRNRSISSLRLPGLHADRQSRQRRPVVASPVVSQSVDEDTAWSYTLPAGLFADPDGDSLTVTAKLSDGSPLPSWLSFDGSTFTGTPPANFNGSVAITLTATDPSAASVSQAFTLAINPVNDAPVVATPVASQSVNEDTAWSYTLPAGLFADPDGDSLTLTANLSDGSPLPSWLTSTDQRLPEHRRRTSMGPSASP